MMYYAIEQANKEYSGTELGVSATHGSLDPIAYKKSSLTDVNHTVTSLSNTTCVFVSLPLKRM